MYLKSNIAKLKARKKELGWTNQKLAKESGVPMGTLNKIFNGTTKYPRDKTIDAIVRAMGLNYYEIEESAAGTPAIRETGLYRAGKRDNRATLDTYYTLPDELRAELIDGKIYYLPAPALRHQSILMILSAKIYGFFEEKGIDGRVLTAPCDVQLDFDNYTMLHPDIFVVLGKEKLMNGMCCMGAPEFVIEITSRKNSEHDYELKRYKYQNAGVREYWIVDPAKKRIVVYAFMEDAVPAVYTFEDKIKAQVFPDLEIDFGMVCREML